MSDAEIIARIARAFPSRFLRGFARGKLRSDPVYRASFARLGDSELPLLDVGCGFGLHAFFLRECGYQGRIVGMDTDEKKIAAGQAIAASGYAAIELRVGDGAALPEFAGNVALLDVLHYFPADAQPGLLAELARRVAPGGWCIIRTTPRDGSWRARATRLGEWFGRLTWRTRAPVAFPTLESVAAAFPASEFTHEVRPLWGRTPFNSWLLAFRRR
jgi:SAM-dependent methyltransferase